jgi:D-xylose transport system substrate-binding protein
MSRNIRWFMVFGLAVIASLVVAGCAPAATPAPPAAPPTTAPTTVPPTTVPPTMAPTEVPPTEAPTQAAAQGPTVQVVENPTLGSLLVDSQGMTLYTFKNDQPGVSNCTGSCATAWPPLTVAQGVTPTAGAGVPGTLGVIERADGTYQVTYDDMPLYLYAKDTQVGDTNGQGVGNVWYVVTIGASMATPSAPAAAVPDFSKLGFPTMAASQDITPGTATTIKAGPFTFDVPADAFDVPVKFEVLTGDLANFLSNTPQGEMPVLGFAFRVTNSQTGELIGKFNNPVMFAASAPSIVDKSMYYNISTDGMYTANPTGMQVTAGELTHPIAGAGVGWVITSPAPAPASGKIALLLPETKTTRYETKDRPDFEAKFMALCPNCQIIYSNANQDASVQLSQAEAALVNGAQVLVLDPVDSAAAASIADKAAAQGVPVIAYDRLILNSSGVNYYISFDNYRVGQLQAQALVDRLSQLGIQNPVIVMINGAPTDNNAKLFKQGAHSVFDPLVQAGKLTIAKEYDTPDWSPDQAQNEMQQALTALGNKVDGVYCANDGTASGAIAAMIAAGLNPLPPVTGQDAELAAIQRILTGQQYMTVYKAIQPEAEAAAQLAYDLLTKTPVPAAMTNGQTVNNGKIDVASVLLTPIAVTKDNIGSTIVKDGFWTVQQICTPDYADACKAAGLE